MCKNCRLYNPDLNPVDCSICNALAVACLRTADSRHIQKDVLVTCWELDVLVTCCELDVLVTCWQLISEDFIDRAIARFRKRIALIIAVKGRHVEYFLISCISTRAY